MTNVTCQIAPGVWTIITYEDSWKSYINNYVVERNGRFYLIDTNLKKHRSYFQQALEDIGATSDKVEDVLCTHRLPDHIGNVELFATSQNWIHLHDFFELDDFSQTLFGHSFTGEKGQIGLFSFVILPTYTEGSVAFFDSETNICFIGDHLHFFGMDIEQVIGYQEKCRKELIFYFVAWLQRCPDIDQVMGFLEATKSLLQWPIEILATGHGPILQGNIPQFLQEIVEILSQYTEQRLA
ncbi:MBL fold metallo-hydrolase [Brevibacillus halotolerans]|nr:MBL fold metallo-hydrolase [Brevibacillus halotolerans]